MPTVAYVAQRAYSAGALITLADHTHRDGAGFEHRGGRAASRTTPKYVSALRAEFDSTAQRNHRDQVLAAAMVDKSVDVPAYKKPGAILTLTAEDAERAGIADAIAPTLDGALARRTVSRVRVERAQYTWGEWLARFATTPEVSGCCSRSACSG